MASTRSKERAIFGVTEGAKGMVLIMGNLNCVAEDITML